MRRFEFRPAAVECCAAGVASLLAVTLLLLFVDLKTTGTAAFADPGWDRHLYIEMAKHNPFDFHLAPFCWRVLVPTLVKVQPFSLQAGFLAIAVMAVLATGVLLSFVLRTAGFSPRLAIAGVLFFFSLGWGPKFVLSDFWIPDSAAFLAIALAFLWILRRRPLLFAITLAVGVAAKESVLFVAPLYYTLNAGRWTDRRLAGETVAAVLPVVLVLVFIRLSITAQNTDASYLATLPDRIARFPEIFPRYSYPSLLNDIGYDQRIREFDADALRSYTFDAFGLFLPCLLLLGLRDNWRLALKLLPFLVLVYAQLLFATDTERLLVAGFPAVIWLAIGGAQTLVRLLKVSEWMVVVLAAGAFALVLTDRASYDVHIAPQLVVAVLCAISLGLPMVARRCRSSAPS